MHVVGIIPARLSSTRLPEKMLLAETGKTLIHHTWEAARATKSLDEVYVATDSERIEFACRAVGASVIMTGEHPSGTDRIAEAMLKLPKQPDIIVNIQGDEPEMAAESVDAMVKALKEHPEASIATPACPLYDVAKLKDPSAVKVTVTSSGRALYFSRSLIPHSRDMPIEDVMEKLDGQPSPWLLHMGAYAYRRDDLLKITQLPPSKLELMERLEQLRALEAGMIIQIATVPSHSFGIDTPSDYAAFVARYRSSQK